MKKDIILIMFLIAAISLLIKGTVHGMDNTSKDVAMESYYRSLEKEYVCAVKECLKEEGYSNAGVMLTKVVDVNGKRDYTLTINHRKLSEDTVDEIKKNDLINKIKIIPLDIDNISFSIMTTS